MAKRRNKLVVPGADQFMQKFKNEIAAELGISDYDNIDKGALPSRVNGAIGGTMVKRLIELGQQALMNQQNNISQSNLDFDSYRNDMIQDLNDSVQQVQH